MPSQRHPICWRPLFFCILELNPFFFILKEAWESFDVFVCCSTKELYFFQNCSNEESIGLGNPSRWIFTLELGKLMLCLAGEWKVRDKKQKKPSHVFGWCEKVERGKILLFDLEENEMIENTIYLNLILCSCYNFFIKIFYKDKKKSIVGVRKNTKCLI